MKPIRLILLLLISFPFILQGQSFRILNGDTINRTDAKGNKQGIWYKLYDNNQPFSISHFKNNKPVDTTFTYYKTGELQGHLVHKSDRKTAYMYSYWPNGTRKAIGKYINQEKDSVWNFYNENDSIRAIESYKLGEPDGVWKVYYKNGVLSEETTYVKGVKSGPFKKYFPDGKLKMSGAYENDSFEGPVLQFYFNGKPAIKGSFSEGLKDGEWVYLNERGTIDSVHVYINGALQEEQ